MLTTVGATIGKKETVEQDMKVAGINDTVTVIGLVDATVSVANDFKIWITNLSFGSHSGVRTIYVIHTG